MTTSSGPSTNQQRGAPVPAPDGVLEKAPDEPSVGDLVKDASTHLSTLMRSEIELAKLELVSSAKKAGIGGGLFGVAAALVLYALTFAFVAAALGIATTSVIPLWGAFLIVFGILLLVAVALAVVGRALIKRVHKPERTMTTVKDTAEWAKHPTKAT